MSKVSGAKAPVGLLFAVILSFFATTASALDLGDNAGPPQRLIVKFKENHAHANHGALVSGLAKGVGLRLGVTLNHLHRNALGADIMKIGRHVDKSEMAALIAEFKNNPDVEYVEEDRIMHALFTPNDSRYNEQWHYFEANGGLRLPGAWDLSTGTGVVVAVIDTGYRPHADLVANIVQGYDFISDTAISVDGNGRDSDAQDPGDWYSLNQCGIGTGSSNSSWHGTHVAGTIAAVTNNTSGVAGVAYNAKVLPARVLGKCGGYTSDIADAIIWASGGTVSGVPANANPAKVLSLSLGGSGACDTTTQNAINSARSRGSVFIVAAGNENQNASNSSPANCTGAVVVAAVGRNGGRASVLQLRRHRRRRRPGRRPDQRQRSQRHSLHAECRHTGSGRRQLRLLPGHLDGHAACFGRRRADARQDAGHDAGSDRSPAQSHRARLPGHVQPVRRRHRRCGRSARRRRASATASSWPDRSHQRRRQDRPLWCDGIAAVLHAGSHRRRHGPEVRDVGRHGRRGHVREVRIGADDLVV